MSNTNNKLSAEQAIGAARLFLTQPGRLSGWLDIKSSDLTLKKLDQVERVPVGGYYSQVTDGMVVKAKIDEQEGATWNITFAVRRFSGKLTVQVFRVSSAGAGPLIEISQNNTKARFLYAKIEAD